MVRFTALISKVNTKGGWSYIVIDKKYAQQLNPKSRTSFRVKGTLDKHPVQKTSLLPMRNGNFMLPINAGIRKATGKKSGDTLKVMLELDERKIALSVDLIKCLKDDPEAMKFFKSLPGSHQQYFSKWIDSAKTAGTKTKRIVTCLTAFSKKMNYSEMMRSYKSFEV